ncbi:MAG: peptidoglycan DD-metalloendopeptidase family protein [Hyphomonas sp.]|uniref:murein hydrolase activator EnvC family protein n=1 Tax=Hyphomonas sp. TaxID=87 RepID=UPI0017D0C5B7|nr:peptidoglycan DD-metalloendopeptidase family protein [Hyphomonas sp.]MBA3068721.1 peptidoglycan DD-metalloendopeptidase family protein [Hyphomonas sp.]MBU3921335.1 peptidoglycan DD-metalloendopeptidase family protein [Alphaproteobacteria bacterium]MBU4063615.1 peptidoglycan DD-metalloendopeptidase family protein [Alphaproteobacteria bacterium]MBU4569164.1 peptidoglycan DD-metalloendopeptidase family protein [Alphaproteobacteria bacterium]
MRFFLPLVACLCMLPLIAAAPDTFTRADLDALEAERAAAVDELRRLESEGEVTALDIRELDGELLSAAMDARRREEQASKAETALAGLSARRETARAELISSEGALEDLLGALAAANRRRPPALVVSPDNSGVAIRRAILMKATYPKLTERAAAISAEISELNALESGIKIEQARLGVAEANMKLKKEEIEQLAAAKRASFEGLAGSLEGLRSRADKLGREAGTLRDLLTALETNAPEAPRVKPESRLQLAALRTTKPGKAKTAISPAPKVTADPLGKATLGGLKQPAAGTLLHGFGDALPSGAKTEFLVFETRAEAQVVAPAGGVIEFARPFRTYGNMLILRTSDGYHVILSGMSRIYVSEGQTVSAGEPVGRMPDRDDPPPELTVELRLGDRVLNPAEWMPRDK